MKRLACKVCYLGTAYCGWQRQKNGMSVQQRLSDGFFKLTQEEVTLHGSGRTDAGVHAIGQVFHFDTTTTIPTDKLPYAWNTMLPDDIRVLESWEVSSDFNARFDVKRKTYIYKFYNSPHSDPLLLNLAYHVGTQLDDDAMQKAVAAFVGTYDFLGFQATGGHVKTTIRTIFSATLTKEGNLYTLELCGNGFLYNMVRIIAGTVLYAGIGKISPEDIKPIILSKDRTRAGKTLPPYGLYLKKVEY